MKQEIYLEDALDDYFEIISKKEDGKKIII